MKKNLFFFCVAFLAIFAGYAQPSRGMEWLTWVKSPIVDKIGSQNGYTGSWGVYHRYDPADLTPFIGQQITKIRYKPLSEAMNPTVFLANPRIKIWTGGNAVEEPGYSLYEPFTLIADVEITDYYFNYYNLVDLPAPIVIDGTKMMWIGIEYKTSSGEPVGVTDPTGGVSYFQGKSNIIDVKEPFFYTSTMPGVFPGTNTKYCWDLAAYTRDPLPLSKCSITVEMNDVFNDGWQEAFISFVDDKGVEWDRVTVNHYGSTATVSFPRGANISCVWNSGASDFDVSFVIKDAEGTVLYTCEQGDFAAQPTGEFFAFTANCGSSGYDCEDVAVESAMFMSLDGIPISTYNTSSYVQQLFTSADLGLYADPVDVSSIAFKYKEYNNMGSVTRNNVTIYLGHTNKTTFNNTTDWVPVGQLQQVFNGSVTFNEGTTAEPWTTITFDQPFKYEGGNLVLAVLDNQGGYSGGSGMGAFVCDALDTDPCVLSTSLNYGTISDLSNPGGYPLTGVMRSQTKFEFCVETGPGIECVDKIFEGEYPSGDGSGAPTHVNNSYGYSYEQQIYYPSEIGSYADPVHISAIGYKYNGTGNITQNNIKIYVGHTAKNEFTSTADWIPVSTLQEVYSGSITFSKVEEWTMIEFPTPFKYEGGNLVVAMLDNSNSGSTIICWQGFTDELRNLYAVNGWQGAINPANPTGFMWSQTSMLAATAKFKVCTTGEIIPPCDTVTNLVANYAPNCTTLELTWTASANASGYNVYRNEQLIGDNISTTSFTDNTFSAFESYTYAVTTVCGNKESDPVEVEKAACLPPPLNSLVENFTSSFPSSWTTGGGFGYSALNGVDNLGMGLTYMEGSAQAFVQTPYVKMGANPKLSFALKVTDDPFSQQSSPAAIAYTVQVSGDLGQTWSTVYTVNVGQHVPADVYQGFRTIVVNPAQLTQFANKVCMAKITFNSQPVGHGIYVCIDDVIMGTFTAYNDLTALRLTGSNTPSVGTPAGLILQVQNSSYTNTLQSGDYTVKLMKVQGGGDVEMLSVPGKQIHPFEIVEIALPYTASTTGASTVYGQVVLNSSDNNIADNKTGNISLEVYPAGAKVVAVGLGNSLNNNAPFNFANQNSWSQTVYFGYELGNAPEEITKIQYFNDFASNIGSAKPIKIYLANIGEQPYVSPTWYNMSAFTLVFDGMVTFPQGQNWVTIEFDQPFMYAGQNMILMAHRGWDNSAYSTSDRFMTTTQSFGNRMRYQASNTNFGGVLPGGGETSVPFFPNIRFHFATEDCLTPNTLTANYTDECAANLKWKVPGVTESVNLRLELQGGYGDSWYYGASITIKVDGVEFGNYTISDYSNSKTYNVEVPAGVIEFIWTAGYYTDQSFQIFDGENNLLYSTNGTGSLFSGQVLHSMTVAPNSYVYNVYRDGTKIASLVPALSYTDSGFDMFVSHTWAVKMACDDKESTAVEVTKGACATCVTPANLAIDYTSDCSAAKLQWEDASGMGSPCGIRLVLYGPSSYTWDYDPYVELFLNGASLGTYTGQGGVWNSDNNYYAKEFILPISSGTLELFSYSRGWYYDNSAWIEIYNNNNELVYASTAGQLYGYSGHVFTYQHECTSVVPFNVYRDGDLVAGNLFKTSYTDTDFNIFESHTWAVKMACGSNESAAVEITKATCANCNPPANVTADYSSDCGSAKIKWMDNSGIPSECNLKLVMKGWDPWYWSYTAMEVFVDGASYGYYYEGSGMVQDPETGIYYKDIIITAPSSVVEFYYYSGYYVDSYVWFEVLNSDNELVFAAQEGQFYYSSGLAFTYQHECATTAPFNLYRDGDLIVGNLYKTSYTDTGYNIFEPHTWGVTMVCGDAETAAAEVANAACATCNPPVGLTLDYSSDCSSAKMKWTDDCGVSSMCDLRMVMYGWDPYYWSGSYSAIEVFVEGASYGYFEGDNMKYDDVDGFFSQEVTLTMGSNEVEFYYHGGWYPYHIWVKIYNANGDLIYETNTDNGGMDGHYGTFFTYQNECAPIAPFNVYRDGDLIAGNLYTTSYTDTDLNPFESHDYEVKMVCGDGESAAAEITKPACANCAPPTNFTATYSANCETAQLAWEDASGVSAMSNIKLVMIGDPYYWSGTSMEVIVNGVSYGAFIADNMDYNYYYWDYFQEITVSVPAGDVEFYYYSGNNDYYYPWFQIYNADEELIYETYGGQMAGYYGNFFTYKNETPPLFSFNVYRNGTKIASNVEGTSYSDTGFNPYGAITYGVTMNCGDGESTAAEIVKAPCSYLESLVEEFNTAFPTTWVTNGFGYSGVNGVDNLGMALTYLEGPAQASMQTPYVQMGNNPKLSFALKVSDHPFAQHSDPAAIAYTVSISKDYGVTWDNLLVVNAGEYTPSEVFQGFHTIVIDPLLLLPYTNQICVAKFTFAAQSGYEIYVCYDDLIMGTFAEKDDLTALRFTGSNTPSVGAPANLILQVRNASYTNTINAGDYTVKLMQVAGGGDVELASAQGKDIHPFEIVEITFPWTPDTEGAITVYGEVVFASDVNPADNKTENYNAEVYPAGETVVAVGLGSALTNAAPFDFAYGNSWSQTVYFDYEMGSESKLITKIQYLNNFTSNISEEKPIKIYMANIGEQPYVSPTWYPMSEFSLVFDGTALFPQGQNVITITLDKPFFYEGQNMIVMAHRTWESTTYSSSDQFFTTPQSFGNRARLQASNTNFNGSLPTGGETSVTFFPNIRFHATELPIITTLTPNDGAIEVPVNNEVSVTFNQDIFSNELTGITINNIDVTANIEDNKLIINHNTFAYNTLYTVFVPANTIIGYTEDITWSFTSYEMKYTITPTAVGGGTLSPDTAVHVSHGANQTFNITPNTGYHIVSIVVDGAAIDYEVNAELTEAETYTFENVTAGHTIVVTFAINCYAMNSENVVGKFATLTMTPTNCVPYGSDVTFNFTADCAEITEILVDGISQPIEPYVIMSVSGPLPKIEVTTVINQFTITATPLAGADPMGTISPAGASTIECGDDITYTFTPEDRHRVKRVIIDGAPEAVNPSNTRTFSNVRANHTLHVEFERFPYYIIQFGPSAAQGQGGKVYLTDDPDVEYYIEIDSNTLAVPFSITPAEGFVIDKVFVDDIANAQAALTGSYVFTKVKAHHSIYATFKPIKFTITAAADPNGTITPSGAVKVAYGNSQDFLAAPKTGYNLSAVYVDGELNVDASTTGVYTFENVMENHEITAFFTKKMYQITTLAGANGSISPANPLVGHGDNVTLTFTPQTGYKVNTVWVDGIENPAAAQAGAYTLLNVTQDHTVEVTFTKMQFTITATHTVGGYIVPAGVAYVEYGAHSEIYVFDSHDGYHVQAAIIDGVNNPLAIENGMYRFMDVTSNHTIHITFAADGFIIEASATEGGTINPAGAVIVPNNTDKTFYFEAYPGSELVRVLIDGINKEEAVQAGNYTFFNVTAHHTIAAQFEKKMYEVIYQPVSGALVTPVEGSSSPVAHGGTYKFVIDLEEGYSQSIIVVRVNGLVLNPFANGVYILNNIVMNQVITIEGVMLNKYEIRAQAFTGGTITPAGVLSVTHGDDKTFEIAPNPGYCIKDVVVNGVSMGATTSYTFHNVKENSTIMAHFAYGQGIDDNDEAAFKIFSHKNVVTILNEQLIPVKQAEILDIYGRLLWVGPVLIEKTEVALNVAVGIYLVRIITADNQQITTKVVIH